MFCCRRTMVASLKTMTPQMVKQFVMIEIIKVEWIDPYMVVVNKISKKSLDVKIEYRIM